MEQFYCIKCGALRPPNSYRCTNCGYNHEVSLFKQIITKQNPITCDNCEKKNPSNAKYCLQCGNTLD